MSFVKPKKAPGIITGRAQLFASKDDFWELRGVSPLPPPPSHYPYKLHSSPTMKLIRTYYIQTPFILLPRSLQLMVSVHTKFPTDIINQGNWSYGLPSQLWNASSIKLSWGNSLAHSISPFYFKLLSNKIHIVKRSNTLNPLIFFGIKKFSIRLRVHEINCFISEL